MAFVNIDLPQQERSGFSARIRRSVTEIPEIMGVQREIFLSWAGVCAFLVILLPWPKGFIARLIVVGLTFGGGTALMGWLGRKDPQWYELLWQYLWDFFTSPRRPPDVLDY